VRAHTLPAWLQCGGEVTPWLLTVSASAGERAPRGGRPPHPALCRSGPGRAAHIPGGAALGQARGAAGRAQRCAAGLPADEALLYDRRAPVAQLVCRSWKRELGPRPPVMWKVPQAVLVREVTLEGGVTQLWPNKDKVVPRIGGSRYVLFTMDNRAQVRRGPRGALVWPGMWPVAAPAALRRALLLPGPPTYFVGGPGGALPFQAGVRTGGCVLAAFQPYDCETRRMTSVSCLRTKLCWAAPVAYSWTCATANPFWCEHTGGLPQRACMRSPHGRLRFLHPTCPAVRGRSG